MTLVALFFLLALATTFPGVSSLALGASLEVERRIALGAPVSRALGDLKWTRKAAATLAAFTVLAWILGVLVAGARDATLVDPSSQARWWILGVLVGVAWLGLKALARRLPSNPREAITRWTRTHSAQLARLLWLGARGWVATVLWLGIPAAFLALTPQLQTGSGLWASVSVVALVLVLIRLPFLQIHFAVEGRFLAAFQWTRVHRLSRKAPIAFAAALLVIYGLTLPLFLLKIFPMTQGATWALATLLLPWVVIARWIAAWAYGRALRAQNIPGRMTRWWAMPLNLAAGSAATAAVVLSPALVYDHWALLPPVLTFQF